MKIENYNVIYVSTNIGGQHQFSIGRKANYKQYSPARKELVFEQSRSLPYWRQKIETIQSTKSEASSAWLFVEKTFFGLQKR